jgi:hypothetical protein
VLERSSDDPYIGDAISATLDLCLLEESWVISLSLPDTGPHLLVFDTLLQQQDPKSWRILQLPQHHHYYNFPIRYGDGLDEWPEFSVDPAQRNLVLHSPSQPDLLLVILIESLIRAVRSARADPYIRWNEWGRDVVEIRLRPDNVAIQFAGTKVLVLHEIYPFPAGCRIEMYDLGESGQNHIESQEASKWLDGGCRRVLSTPNRMGTIPRH